MKQQITDAIRAVYENVPLVHSITNFVVMQVTANALLAAHASPLLAHAAEEMDDLTNIDSSLVLNIGTLDPSWLDSMELAGKLMKKKGKPVVLDPVGAGASGLRTRSALRLLDLVRPDILRGNASEIMALAAEIRSADKVATKGVDSRNSSDEALDAAHELARRFGCVVSVSGERDLITDGSADLVVEGGSPLMPLVTGMGCSASAVTGAYAAECRDRLTAAAAAILEAEGYRNCPESAAWHLVPGGKYYTTRNGSAILAWRMPKGPLTGWHAAASHSDSPTWRIKTLDGADHGFARAEVEGYGGMLMSTWFDRPLSVAGRLLVRTADGVESRLVHPERALACIPNLCIHFNREANTGLNYNPQVDLQPIFGAEGGSLKDTLAAEAGGKAEDILATDLVLCITEKAQRVGLQGEYFMSGRIDDLECAYATLYGFLQGRGEEAGRGDIWVMFDNEEVGSSSRQGAQGSLMSDVLARIEESLGVTKEQSIRARTNCLLLSADNGHAIHPNHPEKSDQKLPVNMGGGVILKYNARQTYTTSGLTGAAFTAICEKAGVPVQTFANRADVAGGSTLGNLLGRQILMPMVDIGVGQLAMHSAMETASCKDAEYLANACAAYYNTPIFQPEDGQWKLGL